MLGKKLSRQVKSLGQKFGKRALSLGMKSKDFLKAGDVALRKVSNTLKDLQPLTDQVPQLKGLSLLGREGIAGLREGGAQARKGIERLEKSNARKVLEDLAENRNPISSFV